jgi:anti-sigma B factor antagonist
VGHFEVRTLSEPERLVVTPVGELDIATVDQVRAAVAKRREGAGLVLDLSELEFMDTSGIQVIVESFRDAREAGFTLSIVRADPQVQRVFEIAGLDTVLPFTDGDG